MDRYHDFIVKLAGVSDLLEGQIDLEEGLREVAKLTAQMLKTQRCSIMLLNHEDTSENPEPYLRVFAHYGNLPEAAYQEVTRLNEGIAGYVAATGEPIFIQDISQSPFAQSARYLEANQKSSICVPIQLGKQVIGTINVSFPVDRTTFDTSDLELLKLFALFVGKSIHIAQIQMILRSKFVERAVVHDLAERQVTEMLATDLNPTKVAKIVAKSFFKELTQAGFSTNQVIAIATEVLFLLQDNLNRHKKRLARDEEEFNLD